MSSARQYLHVREATGHNDGVEVEAMLAEVGMRKGNSWCGAFVHRALTDANVSLPGRPSSFAWAPTWHPERRIIWKASTSQTQRRSSAVEQVPMPGDVFGIYYHKLQRVAHVGIVQSWGVPYCITVEGNTGSTGSREGDGVYVKKRQVKQLYCVSRWTEC